MFDFSHNTQLYTLFRSTLPKRCRKTRLFFNPFFNGFHSRTLVQVIGNKSADLGKLFLNRVHVYFVKLSQKRPNFEMYLKFNLGPLHLLDNFVKEILASDSTKSYLRKEQYKISRLVTNDLNKSAAMETIEKRIENKSRFPTSFWQDTSR